MRVNAAEAIKRLEEGAVALEPFRKIQREMNANVARGCCSEAERVDLPPCTCDYAFGPTFAICRFCGNAVPTDSELAERDAGAGIC